MNVFDYVEMKRFIDETGKKQKVIAEKADMSEVQLCMILQGKRKCEAGEYICLCKALEVEPGRFMTEK